MRLLGVSALATLAIGCLPSTGPGAAGPPREHVESLWDLAPRDASDGVVFHEGSFAKALALGEKLAEHKTPHPKVDAEKKKKQEELGLPPLATFKDWSDAGLDPDASGAAFSWPDRDRGALFVLPVKDHAAFRRAFKAATTNELGREVDHMARDYVCVEAVEHVVCAKSLAEIDASIGRHSSPVAWGGEHLAPDDTGDVEIYATPKAPHVAEMAEEAKDYGKLVGVASAVRIRPDGATLRVHAIGEMRSALARAFAGAAPKDAPPAGSPTMMQAHFDPEAVAKESKSSDEEEKKELLEQLTGDIEVTTSGRGLFGLHATLDLKDAGRVERYVKKQCEDAGGFKLGTGLRKITVTDHGCSAIFDSKLTLLPASLDPIPLSAEVRGTKLVIAVGDGRAPTTRERTTAGVVPESDAAFALADSQAVVAFTASPWIGPDVGAGDAFKRMFWLMGDVDASRIDAFNDIAAHVAQAFLAGRVQEDGVIVTAGILTFEHDPPEVHAAYDKALTARAAGDVHGYRAQLAAIEKMFPSSLAAQRAAEVREGGPFAGAGVVAIGSVGVWLDALGSIFHARSAASE